MNEQIKEHLYSNIALYREVFYDDYKKRCELIKTEPQVFHSIIDEQFNYLLRQKISDDISKSLGCPVDEVISVLEDVSLKEMFNE